MGEADKRVGGREYGGSPGPCRHLIRPRAPDAQLAEKHRLDAKCT